MREYKNNKNKEIIKFFFYQLKYLSLSNKEITVYVVKSQSKLKNN